MSFNSLSRLVDYSSDESEDEIIDQKTSSDLLKNNVDEESPSETSPWEPLPLPLSIQLMYKNTTDSNVSEEDSSKHGGKIRSFPHERGVWASYVYIEYEPESEFLEMIVKFREHLTSNGFSMEVFDSFHVSLSKTLKLRQHWIAPLVDSLKVHLRSFYKFKLIFQSLEVYENEEKTRTFLGMKVHIGIDGLLKLSKQIDECLSEFKLPCFYQDPSFHLSFASFVGSKSREIELLLADLNVIFQSHVESEPQIRTLWVSKVCFKSGNKLFVINLKS